MHTIKLEVKKVYGNNHAYPACEMSQLFLSLSGKKTFSAKDVAIIKSLGFTVEFVTPTL